MELIDPLSSNNEIKQSFVFILNDIDVEGKFPIEVAPNHFFQKADTKQIRMIKECLSFFMPLISSVIPYEVNVIKTYDKQKKSFIYTFEPLKKEQWKYWVITFTGANLLFSGITSAASLIEHDLELGFSFVKHKENQGHGFQWHQESLNSFFFDRSFPEPATTITSDEIRQISGYYKLINKINPEHEHISRALSKFNDLKSLPRKSELVIIGLFSVIESLITHSPKLTESADSLTHQIRTKIPLLTKRFDRKLDYDKYFQLAPEDTIWSKLYKYRSNLVHGERSHIDNTLKVLKDRRNVMEFLKETTKLLLLLSLRESTLVTDLKKC